MWRYSFGSKDLEGLRSQLLEIGYKSKKREDKDLTYKGKIVSKDYLEIGGESINCYLYPTSALVLLRYGKKDLSENDVKLLEFVKKEYRWPIPRELPVIMGAGIGLLIASC